jgi:hypothetical protein
MCQCPHAHPFIKSNQVRELLRSIPARIFIAAKTKRGARDQIKHAIAELVCA